jgi:hypothetical protein
LMLNAFGVLLPQVFPYPKSFTALPGGGARQNTGTVSRLGRQPF